jgi:tetratricopeptide (TPR) repeat protein
VLCRICGVLAEWKVWMKRQLYVIAIFFILIASLTGCGKAGSFSSDGRKNFKNGNFEQAAECFEAAIAANPNIADYYIDYGLTLIKLGKYKEAISQFEHAYLDKDMLTIRQNNKRCLRGKGIAYYEMQQYEDAVEQFELALKINVLSELDMDILYYKADSLRMTGDYEESTKAYTKILKLDKKSSLAYSARACSYKCMGEDAKSLADFESAIALEPKNYDYYFGKYYLLSENGDEAGAAKVLEDAESIAVVTTEDEYNLAKIHFYQENYDLAASELSEGYAAGFKEAYYYLGEIYRLKKDYEKAAYYYEIFIESKEVKDSNVFNQIAVSKMKLGDYETALEYLEKGLAYQKSGTLRILKKNEIVAYENLGRYEEAKEKLVEYLESFPEDEDAEREAKFIETRVLVVNEAETPEE